MIRRLSVAAALLAASALAGPPLTTIQDVLYKADGTRFNGTVTISWRSFVAIDNSTITTQSLTVKVVDGNLRVRLVPTTSATPAATYAVTYNSDGRVQFQETWAVPSSAQPLRVRDVRVGTPSGAVSADTGGGAGGPVQESDVVGLIADLGARPVKGPGFAAGRVAVVNATGGVESATGNPSDCVRVDGSSGPCGETAPSFVDGDSPAGIVDGSNAMFTLSAIPDPVTSLAVYRNGVLQKAAQDFTLTGNTVQFISEATPQPGDTLLASYRLSGAQAASPQQLYPGPQVLCSGTGASTNSSTFANLGACTIPAGILAPGDRVEIRFDLAHQGSASGSTFAVQWGATTVVQRDAAAAETLIAGRADAAILAVGAQVSWQSWGAVLAFGAGVGNAADDYNSGIAINFQGKVATGADTLSLSGFTVVRVP